VGSERSGKSYSDEALSTFPRYVLLNAILIEVERFRQDEFETLDEAKQFYCEVAKETRKNSIQPADSSIALDAALDERVKLSQFILATSDVSLNSVEPLFYRRVLSDSEGDLIRVKLKEYWNVDRGYWFPLTTVEPKNVKAFQDFYFENEVGVEKVQNLLKSAGRNNVFEIREFGANYEFELSVFEPHYNGAEGFWCDDQFDWIIYTSHESSITVGGWLLGEIQANWPNWNERIWPSPFF
jgi:hypothetical protein